MIQKGVLMASVAVEYKFVEVLDGAYKGARGVAYSRDIKMWGDNNMRAYYTLYKGKEMIELDKPVDLKCRVIKKHESLEGVRNGKNN